jgi:hypothetical protein
MNSRMVGREEREKELSPEAIALSEFVSKLPFPGNIAMKEQIVYKIRWIEVTANFGDHETGNYYAELQFKINCSGKNSWYVDTTLPGMDEYFTSPVEAFIAVLKAWQKETERLSKFLRKFENLPGNTGGNKIRVTEIIANNEIATICDKDCGG